MHGKINLSSKLTFSCARLYKYTRPGKPAEVSHLSPAVSFNLIDGFLQHGLKETHRRRLVSTMLLLIFTLLILNYYHVIAFVSSEGICVHMCVG